MISLCKKLNIIYNIITCNPEPNGLKWCLIHERIILVGELVEPVHQIGLNRLKQFTARAAQIYNLLHQNSLSDLSAVSDPMMNELIQRSSPSNNHWTEETVQLKLKSDEPLICACVNWRGKMKDFMISHSVKWWAAKMFIRFICFRCKISMFHIIIGCFNNVIVYTLHHCVITWTNYLFEPVHKIKLSNRTSSWKRIGFPHLPEALDYR